jgi:ribose 5-phosphate isomerase B
MVELRENRMRIAIAADHAGFSLKEKLRDELRRGGHEVRDLGTSSTDSTDYPDYAAAVAREVTSGAVDRGLLVCSTGVGMSIAANKIPGVRAAVASGDEQMRLTREHNDLNVLALGAKLTPIEDAVRWVDIFLQTPFDGGARHSRRLDKIAQLENAAPQRAASEEYASK